MAGQNGQLNSLESAGGIGGLLAVYDTNGTTSGQNPTEDDKTYVYLYDANGNVGQLVDWIDIPDWESKQLTSAQAWHADRLVARYEYDPYGNVVGPDTGLPGDPYTTTNPFRFSTKQWDDETGLGYWGYRYYSPTLGRWISRDPIGVRGDLSLYRYARNAPASLYDPLGLQDPGWTHGIGTDRMYPPYGTKGVDLDPVKLPTKPSWCRKCAVLLFASAEPTWGSTWMAVEIADDEGCDLVHIATLAQFKHLIGDGCYRRILIIAEGVDLVGRKIPKWPWTAPWATLGDADPGILVDPGSDVALTPGELRNMPKSCGCLEEVELFACYQAFGRRSAAWSDAFGEDVDVKTYSGECTPVLRWLIE